MEPDHTSHDLLAHFDHPKLVEVERSVDRRVPGVERSERPARSNQRNTLWLLKWTAATAVLLTAASILLEFADLFVAEHALTLAARAGATEATLPRATYQSVSSAVERRLAAYPAAQGQLQLTILRNGQPVGSQLHATEGDRFAVTISTPAAATLPNWLRKILPWQHNGTLLASAERSVAGRKLAISRRYTAAE